jgi:hypothetical protein
MLLKRELKLLEQSANLLMIKNLMLEKRRIGDLIKLFEQMIDKCMKKASNTTKTDTKKQPPTPVPFVLQLGWGVGLFWFGLMTKQSRLAFGA